MRGAVLIRVLGQRLFLALLVLIALAGGILAGGRIWLASDGGRAFLLKRIDGYRLDGLGVIRAEGLTGDPLTGLKLARLSLVDLDGIWLDAREVELDWSPLRLFSRELRLDRLAIARIDISRRPHSQREAEGPGGAPPDFALAVERATVGRLTIASGVAGQAAAFSIDLDGHISRVRDGDINLNVTPRAGPGDSLSVKAIWSKRSKVSALVSAAGPTGGALADILGAPKDSVLLSVRAEGVLRDMTGSLSLRLSAEEVAGANLVIRQGKAELTGQAALARLAPLQPLARRLGDAIQISASADLASLSRIPFAVRASAAAGKITLESVGDAERGTLTAPIRLRAEGVQLARFAPVEGIAAGDGELRVQNATAWRWRPRLSVSKLRFPGGGAASLDGPVVISSTARGVDWETREAVARGLVIDALPRLQPADWSLSTRGDYAFASGVISVAQGQARGAAGEVTARGDYALGPGALKFAGAMKLTSLATITPLSGSANGTWTWSREQESAPMRIGVDVTGDNVGSATTAWAQLLGRKPHIAATFVRRGRDLATESGAFEGEGATAKLTGDARPDGAIAAVGWLRLRRPLSLGGVRIEAGLVDLDASGQLHSPHLRMTLSGGRATMQGVALTGMRGVLDLSTGEALAGNISLAGEALHRPLRLSALIAGDAKAPELHDARGAFGELEFASKRIAFADGVSANLRVSGPLDELPGVATGRVSATGTLLAKGGGLTFQAAGSADGIRAGEAQLARVTFDVSGDGSGGDAAVRLRAHAIGRIRAPADLSIDATAMRSGAGWVGRVGLTGSLDKTPVSTLEPMSWSMTGAGGWTARGALTFDGGRFAIDASSTAETAHATMSASGVDLRTVTRLAGTPPLDGALAVEATYDNGREGARGNFKVNLTGLNPAGLRNDPVALEVSGQLAAGVLRARAQGAGQGFRLDAAADVPVAPGSGFSLTPAMDRPGHGQLDLSGKVNALWTLVGPPDQTLSGTATAHVSFNGAMRSPLLAGDFALSDGAYAHAPLGLKLRDLNVAGAFRDKSIDITTLTATDGRGGGLNGGGRVVWDGQIDGAVRLHAARFAVLQRDDRRATVSGDAAIEFAQAAVTATGDLNIDDARFSIEQPSRVAIPVLVSVRRINFVGRAAEEDETPASKARPVNLDIRVRAPRKVVVYGRGLDTEWSTDLKVGGTADAPLLHGDATLVRGDLDLAGRRFVFDSGSVHMDGPAAESRVDVVASRTTTDVTAKAHVTGTPANLKFTLESTPALPQDEVLSRVLFNRSLSQLSGLETAQLAAALAQLASGTAAFDPTGLLRNATGIQRVSVGSEGGVASVSAGAYITDDVYLEVGAGGVGGAAATVEWRPRKELEISSTAQGNGDTRIAVRWKKDY